MAHGEDHSVAGRMGVGGRGQPALGVGGWGSHGGPWAPGHQLTPPPSARLAPAPRHLTSSAHQTLASPRLPTLTLSPHAGHLTAGHPPGGAAAAPQNVLAVPERRRSLTPRRAGSVHRRELLLLGLLELEALGRKLVGGRLRELPQGGFGRLELLGRWLLQHRLLLILLERWLLLLLLLLERRLSDWGDLLWRRRLLLLRLLLSHGLEWLLRWLELLLLLMLSKARVVKHPWVVRLLLLLLLLLLLVLRWRRAEDGRLLLVLLTTELLLGLRQELVLPWRRLLLLQLLLLLSLGRRDQLLLAATAHHRHDPLSALLHAGSGVLSGGWVAVWLSLTALLCTIALHVLNGETCQTQRLQ